MKENEEIKNVILRQETITPNERLKEVEQSLKVIQKEWITAYETVIRLIHETDTEKK